VLIESENALKIADRRALLALPSEFDANFSDNPDSAAKGGSQLGLEE